MPLEDTFLQVLSAYQVPAAQAESLWKEISQAYSSPKRHYHHLGHLEDMLHLLNEAKDLIQEKDAVLLALFYHDIVYNTLKKDNEEQSAVIAVKRLTAVGLPAPLIHQCREAILATKKHTLHPNEDINLFTDADLAILGSTPETYKQYGQAIRKEYAIYPDLLYKPGRRKVLEQFLNMEHIYKTSFFRERFEYQARKNIEAELS